MDKKQILCYNFFIMRKLLIFFIVCLSVISVFTIAHAQPAEFKDLNDNDVKTKKVTLHYKNISGAQQFKFQIWSKGIDRGSYNRDKTFHKKRGKKSRTWFTLRRKKLTSNRDYKIRYRAVYGGGRQGQWSDYVKFTTKQPSIVFNLTVDDAFPAHETPYVEIDSSSDIPSGATAMTPTGDNTWSATVTDAYKGDVVKFRYSRNGLGAPSYELFEPDNPDYLRSVTMSATPYEVNSTITDWRWLDNPLPSGDVSTDNILIQDRDSFIISMGLLDYHWDQFDPLVESTMQNIAAKGFSYVTIYHSPRVIVDGDPVTLTGEALNTQTTAQLQAIIAAAETAGLQVILAVMMEVDPDNADEINNEITGKTHNDSYYENYLTRWRETMRDGIEIAIDNNLPIVVLHNPWHFMQYVDDDQKAMVNSNIKGLLSTITSGYTGFVTTEYYANDSKLDFYNSAEIDWIGTKWWPDLTDSYSPTVIAMENDAITDSAEFEAINTRFSKPVFFNQLVVHSWDGAAGPESGADSESEPYSEYYADDPDNPIDYQEQADAYEALFRTIAGSDYVIGATSFSYTYHTQFAKSANIRSKVAEDVWARWATMFNDQINN